MLRLERGPLLVTTLAVSLAHLAFAEVEFVTDRRGADLAAALGWQFDNVNLALEDFTSPGLEHVRALGKLAALLAQDVPCVQFDGDVLLFKPLPSRVTRARLMAQSPDVPEYYRGADMERGLAILGLPRRRRAYNAGLLGGADVPLLHDYAASALALADKLRGHDLDGTTASMLVEQYHPGVFAERHLVEVKTLLPAHPLRREVGAALRDSAVSTSPAQSACHALMQPVVAIRLPMGRVRCSILLRFRRADSFLPPLMVTSQKFSRWHALFLHAGLLVALSNYVFAAPAAGPVQFNRDIRPVLNAHCLKCHGGVKEAGDLNLQFREQALRAGETGEIAIVPGKPEESAFIERLTTDDKSDRMPKKEPPLPKEKIELLRQWIAEGAKWENHWAYAPPRGSGQGIDALVSARLATEKLTLAPEADVRTLARRVSLDLIGLPPEPARVEVLEKAADREAALREFVEEQLASPAFGERWAAPWLDLARYADSKGYESDRLRDMWRYRDWVIDALNTDMPYDRFVTEQLAGDLLPNATGEQLIATAFHRNTPQNDEGGTDDEEFRTYAVLDRVNTTFDALQGTSIGCVQCHGHPYDPFVHREYYELVAFFNNTADADRNDQSPTRKFRARADQAKGETLEQETAATQAKLDAEVNTEAAKASFEAWLGELEPASVVPALSEVEVSATAGDYRVQPKGRIRLEGAAPARTTITVAASLAAGEFSALMLNALPDDALPGKGPGASPGAGNFVLTRVRAVLLADGRETPLEFSDASASFQQHGWPVAAALTSGEGELKEGESGWAIAGGAGRVQTATFALAKTLEVPAGAKLRVILECENERWAEHVLGSFRLGVRRAASPAFAALPKELQTLAATRAVDPAAWKPEDRAQVARHFHSSRSAEIAQLYKTLDEHRAALAALPVCDLPIMQELAGKDARKTRVFHRGNWMDKAAEVQPATPQILNRWHDEYPRNRLGFAQWLTNGENPLTARVQVNRVWEQLFGIGLVETLEDFGSQGDKPVHQELLDELAVRFQTEMKWSQKALLREIVLSRVYRQSSKATKTQIERDPANRLLARGPRFRLGNEQLRDQALALGGLLSRKMAGKPVMPFQPAGTWLTPYEGVDWKTSSGEDAHRRAIYTLIRRSATYPSMITFDAPNREFCVVRRIRTNTPLQSLDLLNSPVFMEAAAGLARRMTEPGGTLDEQLARGLAMATLRAARPDEIAVFRQLHERTGGSLTLVANAILNLDEVLNKN